MDVAPPPAFSLHIEKPEDGRVRAGYVGNLLYFRQATRAQGPIPKYEAWPPARGCFRGANELGVGTQNQSPELPPSKKAKFPQ